MLNKIYRCIRIAQSSDIHLVFSVTSSQLLHFIIFIMCNPLLSPVPAGVVILTLLHLWLYCEFLSPPSQCVPPCAWMLLNCICWGFNCKVVQTMDLKAHGKYVRWLATYSKIGMLWNKRLLFRRSIIPSEHWTWRSQFSEGKCKQKKAKTKKQNESCPVGTFCKGGFVPVLHICVKCFVCTWKHTCVQMLSVYVYLYKSYETYILYFKMWVHFFNGLYFLEQF